MADVDAQFLRSLFDEEGSLHTAGRGSEGRAGRGRHHAAGGATWRRGVTVRAGPRRGVAAPR